MVHPEEDTAAMAHREEVTVAMVLLEADTVVTDNHNTFSRHPLGGLAWEPVVLQHWV
jgi:hypothetical protein